MRRGDALTFDLPHRARDSSPRPVATLALHPAALVRPVRTVPPDGAGARVTRTRAACITLTLSMVMFVGTQSMDRASGFESPPSGDDVATQSRLSLLRRVFDQR